jgi:hypothetical protein
MTRIEQLKIEIAALDARMKYLDPESQEHRQLFEERRELNTERTCRETKQYLREVHL